MSDVYGTLGLINISAHDTDYIRSYMTIDPFGVIGGVVIYQSRGGYQ